VSDAVAVFDGVSFAYGAAPVLSDVSFKVGAHEFVSIVGPNGGGKTTLLRLLLGLEDPQRGRVEVLGTTPRRARMDIGYMPQHLRFDPLFPITSIEVVLMGRIRADASGTAGTTARRRLRRWNGSAWRRWRASASRRSQAGSASVC
jgi:ABC-type Mn2+/Zn2+ transport system ATPase subunit